MMYRLVVIDADGSVLNCITHSTDWNALGFEVVATFSDSEDAVAYLKCTPVDAVLLAAELPGTTGMDVAVFIHQNLPGCCVVMMSALRDYDLVKRAMQYGVCDYMLKPVDSEELRKSFEMVRQKLDRSGKPSSHKQEKASNNRSAALVQRVMDYVDKHILEDVSLETVSEQIHISASHLTRIFKKETGYTYLEYVTRKKMEKAAEYLEKEKVKVYEVSEKLGYRSTRHFSTLFSKQYGCYPSEYFDNLVKK